MAKKIMAFQLLVAILMTMSLSTFPVRTVMTCDKAMISLMPCLRFLQGAGSEPGSSCCSGVQRLTKMAETTQMRRDLCVCLKKAAKSFGIDVERAKMVPEMCKIKVPVPIDPNIDCSKIK